MRGAVQRIALGVVLEGTRVISGVLEGLAERKVELQAFLRIELGTRHLRLHRGKIRCIEAEGLEIGEAPVGLTEGRIVDDALPVGVDAVVLAAFRLQHVAVAQPELGMRRILIEQLRVDPARALVLADPAQDDGAQIAVARAARIRRQQALDFRERPLGVVEPVQQHGVVVPRGRETRRELETTLEQLLRVFVAAATDCDLGQHANRGRVGGRPLEIPPQQRLGHGNIVPDHRHGCLPHVRMVRRRLDVTRVGGVAALVVTDGQEVIAERAPRSGVIRLQ